MSLQSGGVNRFAARGDSTAAVRSRTGEFRPDTNDGRRACEGLLRESSSAYALGRPLEVSAQRPPMERARRFDR
eukprot:8945790-Pyramimonas_sp.AAC.1